MVETSDLTAKIGVASGSNATTWSSSNLTDNVTTVYRVDPDVAVDTTNTANRHIAFMQNTDDTFDCNTAGGGLAEYLITYDGPFDVVVNDGGEDLDDPTADDPNCPSVRCNYFPLIGAP